MKAQICRPKDHNIFGGNDSNDRAPRKIQPSENDLQPGDFLPNNPIASQTSNSCSANIVESRTINEIISKESIFIKGGKLVNSEYAYEADILIEDGRIKNIGADILVPPSTTTIDVTGSLILPGGLDYFNYFLHDDFNKFVEFSKETLIDGTTCAVLTLICPPGISPAKLSKSFLSASEVNRPLCDFALRVGMCEIQETTLKEMEEMVRCLGIISFLFFSPLSTTSTSTSGLGNSTSAKLFSRPDPQLSKALTKCRELGAVATVSLARPDELLRKDHSATRSTSSSGEEALLVESIINLSYQTHCPVVILGMHHPSTMNIIMRMRRRCPSAHIYTVGPHLLLEEAGGDKLNSSFLAHLAIGEIGCVVNDHLGCASRDKTNGRLSETWRKAVSKGWLDLPSFVKVTSSHPAQLCGLYPSKGRLAVGCDADLAIWPGGGLLEPSYYGSQPGDLKTHQDPVGVPAAGSARSPMLVILNGKVVVKAGQIVGADALVAGEGLSDACRQAGRYQAASAFPRHIYRLVFASEHVEGSSYETISHQPWVEDEPSEATTPFETNSSLPETHDATRLGSGEIDTSHQASGSRQSGRRNLHISGFSLNGEH